MSRIGLIDVDDTLLLSTIDTELGPKYVPLNAAVIEKLKKLGIKDLYLFTDMLLSPSSVKERQLIVGALELNGFQVHGVITPADCVWRGEPRFLEGMYEFFSRKENLPPRKKVHKKEQQKDSGVKVKKSSDVELKQDCGDDKKKEDDTKTKDDTEATLSTRIQADINYQNLTKLFEETRNDPKSLGRAFGDASKGHDKTDPKESASITLKSMQSKSFAQARDIVMHLLPKGAMFELFLNNRASGFNECYLFDDRQDVLINAEKIIQKTRSNIKLHTYHVDKSLIAERPSLDINAAPKLTYSNSQETSEYEIKGTKVLTGTKEAKEIKTMDGTLFVMKQTTFEPERLEAIKQKILVLGDWRTSLERTDKKTFLESIVNEINKLQGIASLEEIFLFMENEGGKIKREGNALRFAGYGNTKSYESIVSALINRYFNIAKENPHEAYGIYKHAKTSPLFNADYIRGTPKLPDMTREQRLKIAEMEAKSAQSLFFVCKRSSTASPSYDSEANEIRFKYNEHMSTPLEGAEISSRFKESQLASKALISGFSAAHKVGSLFFQAYDAKEAKSDDKEHKMDPRVTDHIHAAFYLHARVSADKQNDGIVAAIADGQSHLKVDKVEDNKILRAAKFAAKYAVIEFSQFTDPDLLKDRLKDIKDAIVNRMVKKGIDGNDAALAAYATFNDGEKTRVVGFSVGKNMIFAWDPTNHRLTPIYSPIERDQATIRRHGHNEFNVIDCEIPRGSVVIALSSGAYEFLPQLKEECKQEKYLIHGSDPIDPKTFKDRKFNLAKRYAIKVSDDKYEEFNPNTIDIPTLEKMKGKHIYRIETLSSHRVSLDPKALEKIIGDAKDAPAVVEKIHQANLEQAEFVRSKNAKAKDAGDGYAVTLGDDYSIGAAQLRR